MSYNLNNLISLIEKAKGSRTLNQFALLCNLDPGHLSRILNKKIKNPPKPETLKKISLHSYDKNITYEILMKAAGYLKDNLESEEISKTDKIYLNKIDPETQKLLEKISTLSEESKKDLEKHIELLKIKDELDKKARDETSSTLEGHG